MRRFLTASCLALALFVALAALLFVWLKQSNNQTQTIPLSAFWQQVKATPPNIERIVIDGDEVSGSFKNASLPLAPIAPA